MSDPALGLLALADYRSATRPALEMLAREAAVIEIDVLDRAMRDVEARLAGKRLQESYFVICGEHQPRYKELSKIYIRRWLGDAGIKQLERRLGS